MSWIRSLVLFLSPRHPGELQNEDIRFLDAGKDRFTLISDAALEVLRKYYRAYKPVKWLFEG
jgi:hypothetical protein